MIIMSRKRVVTFVCMAENIYFYILILTRMYFMKGVNFRYTEVVVQGQPMQILKKKT